MNKISAIRDNLDSLTLPISVVHQRAFVGSSLTVFHLVPELTVTEVLNKITIKPCELDPLPSSLLAELVGTFSVLSFSY